MWREMSLLGVVEKRGEHHNAEGVSGFRALHNGNNDVKQVPTNKTEIILQKFYSPDDLQARAKQGVAPGIRVREGMVAQGWSCHLYAWWVTSQL